MHFEILVEDSSGKALLDLLIPKICSNADVTFTIRNFKGVGKLPKDLHRDASPKSKILLQSLPARIRGYGRTYPKNVYPFWLIIVVDSDKNDCKKMLSELNQMLDMCSPQPNVLFRLAIEEMEAWLLGDRDAIKKAYPKAKISVLKGYGQDSVCGTWEVLADVVYPGGSVALKKKNHREIGTMKHEWARQIGSYMNIEANTSPSFCKLRDGLRKVCALQKKPIKN